MLFVATCVDKPQSLNIRTENRPAHLSYLNGLGSRVKIAGALLAPDHQTPVGSMIIYEGENETDVLSLVDQDPFSLAGLFESVAVKPWRQGVGQSLT